MVSKYRKEKNWHLCVFHYETRHYSQANLAMQALLQTHAFRGLPAQGRTVNFTKRKLNPYKIKALSQHDGVTLHDNKNKLASDMISGSPSLRFKPPSSQSSINFSYLYILSKAILIWPSSWQIAVPFFMIWLKGKQKVISIPARYVTIQHEMAFWRP